MTTLGAIEFGLVSALVISAFIVGVYIVVRRYQRSHQSPQQYVLASDGVPLSAALVDSGPVRPASESAHSMFVSSLRPTTAPPPPPPKEPDHPWDVPGDARVATSQDEIQAMLGMIQRGVPVLARKGAK